MTLFKTTIEIYSGFDPSDMPPADLALDPDVLITKHDIEEDNDPHEAVAEYFRLNPND